MRYLTGRSFLEDPKNFNLIRWSTAGDSFIVFDEEEFAKTLIPELFKHANYASFVRQLNMYGFHKKVGLSDNSMRASERKNKSPSEYANQFFRRDRPNWMWLISKPKTAPGKGKASRTKQADGGPEDEDELFDGEITGHAIPPFDESGRPRQPLLIGQGDPSMVQEQLAAVHQELREIRHSHALISDVIKRLRQDQEQRAAQFREANDRHENSINAILTFLATVYSRNVDGHTNQNVANLFGASMPHELGQSGTVVDVGDINVAGFDSPDGPIRRSPRRQPLLLKAPPPSDAQTVHTMSAASTPAADNLKVDPATPSNSRMVDSGSPSMDNLQMPTPRAGTSASNQPFKTNGASNAATPEGDFLSMINSANAKDANQDFPNRMSFGQALSHLETANGNSPLSANQRTGMLQLMANASGAPATDNTNNAMVSPTGLNFSGGGNLDNWSANNEANMAFLERTLKEQEDKMSSVSNRLRPLSPGGTIPGLHDGAPAYAPQPNDLDLDQLLNDDYFNNPSNGAAGGTTGGVFEDGGDDVNSNGGFSFGDPVNDNGIDANGFAPLQDDGDRLVETVNNSEATSPASAAIDDVGALEEVQSPRKKRKRN